MPTPACRDLVALAHTPLYFFSYTEIVCVFVGAAAYEENVRDSIHTHLLLYGCCFKSVWCGDRPDEVPEAMLVNEPAWVQRTPTCGAKIKAAYSDHNARMSAIHSDTPEPLYKIAEGKIILFSPPVVQRRVCGCVPSTACV